MLCSFCRSIDFSKLSHGDWDVDSNEHHASFKDLIQSANDGCELCHQVRLERSRSIKPFDGRKDSQIYYSSAYHPKAANSGPRGISHITFTQIKPEFVFLRVCVYVQEGI